MLCGYLKLKGLSARLFSLRVVFNEHFPYSPLSWHKDGPISGPINRGKPNSTTDCVGTSPLGFDKLFNLKPQ